MLEDLERDPKSKQHCLDLQYDWDFWARRNQLPPPGDWSYWTVNAGRGFGKTRCGAEWVNEKAFKMPRSQGALLGPTLRDATKTMLSAEARGAEDASGILAISPPWFRPRYHASKQQLIWPNGTIATLFTAEEPDRLRGPQHHWGWVDEVAAWGKNPDAWDQLMFGMRLGKNPQVCVTTTPRPLKLLKALLSDPAGVVTRGSTYENRANLAPGWFKNLIKKYEGTRLGQQELHAVVLDDVPGALWQHNYFWNYRVDCVPCDLARVVVAIDPSVKSNEDSAECGVVVAGVGVNGHGYVLSDLSDRCPPPQWCRTAISAYDRHKADCIVAEDNNGGDMIASLLAMIRGNVRYTSVHASRGKITRAEPIAALYEQGLIHHVGPHDHFMLLEEQCLNYVPGQSDDSPDRMDALVWAFTELFMGTQESNLLVYEHPYTISKW